MRIDGTLTKWNDERGFGFISQGATEVFVHISAFPRDGIRPTLNEPVSFETEVGANGKLRAVNVMRPSRPDAKVKTPAFRVHSGAPRRRSGVMVLLVAVLAAFAYSRSHNSGTSIPVPGRAQSEPYPLVDPNASFHCDGRTLCSQMRSCAEARYFLAHCPNTKMDGNHDGDPCEQQWCN